MKNKNKISVGTIIIFLAILLASCLPPIPRTPIPPKVLPMKLDEQIYISDTEIYTLVLECVVCDKETKFKLIIISPTYFFSYDSFDVVFDGNFVNVSFKVPYDVYTLGDKEERRFVVYNKHLIGFFNLIEPTLRKQNQLYK